jgi:hypothetical protein
MPLNALPRPRHVCRAWTSRLLCGLLLDDLPNVERVAEYSQSLLPLWLYSGLKRRPPRGRRFDLSAIDKLAETQRTPRLRPLCEQLQQSRNRSSGQVPSLRILSVTASAAVKTSRYCVAAPWLASDP